jgi:broad specificity phosphatase PhoE
VAADLLILVKHAKPEVDPAIPPARWTLGVDGLAGSLRLAERLRPLAIHRVVASVEPKATETGRLVADTLDLPFQTGHDLHEHVRSSTGYLAAADFEAAIRRFFGQPSQKVFGDETADAAAARFTTAVDLLQQAYRGECLCVVAHGTVISLHLERRYGVDGFTTWKALETPSFVVVDRRTKLVLDVVRSV